MHVIEKKKTLSFLAGNGEMARLMRERDWSDTQLGPPDVWPQALKTAVRIMLNTRHPIYIFWGPEALCFYNDAYRLSIGSERHPSSLGRPGRLVWDEIWHIIGTQIEQVMAGDIATWHENALVPITRNGVYEDVYWTYSYGPIDDETAEKGVGGVLVICTETTKTVRAEQQLASENERQRRIFQQMPGFVAVLTGPDHVYEYVNDAYVELSGERDFIGGTVRELFPELEGQGFFELLDDVFRTGNPFVARGISVRLAGHVASRYIDLLYAPIRGGDGAVTGIFVGGYDVTEHKRTELFAQALLRFGDAAVDITSTGDISYLAGQVLGEILGVCRVGYGTLDTVGLTFSTEREWTAEGIESYAGIFDMRDLAGYADEIRKGQVIVVSDAREDDRTRGMAALLEARKARAFVNYPIVESNNTVALLYLSHDKVREWTQEELNFIKEVGLRTRLTVERLRSADALRELNAKLEVKIAETSAERQLLADIVESTDAFVQVIDRDFNMLAVNEASAEEFERVFGTPIKVGDNLLERLSHLPDEQAKARAIWSQALEGEPFTVVSEFGDERRDRRCYELKFNPLYDANGNISGAYQFVYDVSQRLRDQDRLAQAEEQLRQAQKMEAVGQLTGGIAHDFNNMLAVVCGSLEMLDRSTKSEDVRAKRLISAASDASRRAVTLTQRLLAFSRQQPLRPAVLDCNRLVSDMSDLFRHSLGADVQLETVLGGDLWRVNADQNQLESVLLNLAVNARDAMPDGGLLTIETQNAHLDARYVASEPGIATGQYVMIAVSDNGAGMPAEVIDRAFDPFFTTKDVGKGTGLGLSQVYGFVKQSGGHVKIYSEPGQGTTIKIYLPRSPLEATDHQGANETPPLEPSKQSELILVVDDEDLVRQFSVAALTDLGYRVLEANNARTALALLTERSDIDLLFTDIVMPETNGRQLGDMARALRPNLRIVYTTGYTRNAVVHNGVVDANVHMLGKPFTLDELATKIRDVLDQTNALR